MRWLGARSLGDHDRIGTSGVLQLALSNGLNSLDHGSQTVAPGQAQMLDEVELVEIAFDIEVQYRLDGLAVVGGQHHTQQAAHDEGVAVSVKMQLVSTALMHQPDLTLTTPDKVLLGAVNLGQWFQLFAQLDNVFVTIFPVIEKTQRFNNIVAGNIGAKFGHGCSKTVGLNTIG